ncbi:MAG: AraC family transcriptional regulator [Ferruginibacter sp.]
MQVLARGKYSGLVTNTSVNQQVIASITSYNSDNFNGELHCHDNAHFSFAIAGGCVERKKDEYEISPGTITYYGAGEQHQVMKIPVETKRINLEIEAGFFRDYCVTEQEARLAITKNPDAKFLMVKMCHELITNDHFSEVAIQLLLLQLIAKSKKLVNESRLPAWVTLLYTYLHEHTDEATSLTELANLTGIHPVTLSKQFPKYFNCTLGEYKRKLKIERSLSLIKSPGTTLTDVAYECGFFDQIHFTRNFKAMNGILPKDFRKL